MRRPWLAALCLTGLVGVAGDARALDLTNTWVVSVGSTVCSWTLVQTGDALEVASEGDCLPNYQLTASGTVDGMAGTFTASGTVFFTPPASESITIDATVSPGETAFSGTVTGESGTQPIAGTLCRNGMLDPGEQCDGGFSILDCCNDACAPEPNGQACSVPPHDQCATDLACAAGACVGTPKPAGTPCWADGNGCTLDQCDGAGACTTDVCSPCCADVSGCGAGPTLATECAHPGARARFVLRTGIPDDHDRLIFRLPRATGPAATDFGDPTAGSDYFLCVVRGDEEVGVRLLLTLQIPSDGACGSSPCWKPTPRGFRYRDRQRAADGVDTLRLTAIRDRAGVRILAGGSRLSRDFVTIPPFPEPVPPGFWVQLRSGDRCWGAFYGAPDVFEPGFIRAAGGQ